jgi:hypothetical protein
MLTSAKIGKQNGDTRTRKPEPGYLNLSNMQQIVASALSASASLRLYTILREDCETRGGGVLLAIKTDSFKSVREVNQNQYLQIISTSYLGSQSSLNNYILK